VVRVKKCRKVSVYACVCVYVCVDERVVGVKEGDISITANYTARKKVFSSLFC
jgi:hypothetical protein